MESLIQSHEARYIAKNGAKVRDTWVATAKENAVFITAKAKEGKTIATPYRNKQNLKNKRTKVYKKLMRNT